MANNSQNIPNLVNVVQNLSNASPKIEPQSTSSNGFSLFGLNISSKYIYILGAILLIVLVFFIWKWYTGTKEEEEEEFDENLDVPTDLNQFYEQIKNTQGADNKENPQFNDQNTPKEE